MKCFLSLFAVVALLGASQDAFGGKDKIDVMTQNQYIGAGLTPLLAAPTPAAYNQALLDILAQIAANNFPERAEALAELIAKRRPDLVGLQEVFVFECADIGPPSPGQGCSAPSIASAFNDHLTLTLSALAAEGETYVVGASVQNLDFTIPVDTNLDAVADSLVSVTDRDVILVRDDIAPSVVPVPYSSFCAMPSEDGGPGCNYQVVVEVNTAVGPINIERGWVGVDATVGDRDYRFVNTHLEVLNPDPTNPLSSVFQTAQAGELIAVLAGSTPVDSTLIVLGDLNSSPEDPIIPGPLPLPSPFDQGIVPPYTQFIEASYSDAWTVKPKKNPGFTCCQLADLSNKKSILSERIDMLFSLDPPHKVKRVRVLGAKKKNKTKPSDLWPSDHGSVAGRFQYK